MVMLQVSTMIRHGLG